MKKPFITRAAQRDIESIWRYISKDSERHANLVQEAVVQTCYRAAENPGIGHRRVDLKGHDISFLVVTSYDWYTVAYLRDSEPTKILRVLHGARNLQKLFRT